MDFALRLVIPPEYQATLMNLYRIEFLVSRTRYCSLDSSEIVSEKIEYHAGSMNVT
jgi:hypothetical protein